MSAWIVSKTHIDGLVHAGIDAELIREEEADEFGRMLWRENLASLKACYPRGGDGGRPGPIGFKDSDVDTYTFEPLDGGLGASRQAPAVVRETASCYDYQSCEHPEWNDSRAKRFVDLLIELHKDAPGKGPWGTDERTAFISDKVVR
jgi:hypothetical protein